MILRDLNDPRVIGFPSITRVKVSDDLSQADVFFTIMGTPGQQEMVLNALRHSAGLMRMKLTKGLNLRVAPYLKLHLDEDLRRELEMMTLLDRVARENEELDRKRAEEVGSGDAAIGSQQSEVGSESGAIDGPAIIRSESTEAGNVPSKQSEDADPAANDSTAPPAD